MTVRQWIALVSSILGVMAGVATSAHYTQWAQLKELTYWLGVVMTLCGSGGLFATGLSIVPSSTTKSTGGSL